MWFVESSATKPHDAVFGLESEKPHTLGVYRTAWIANGQQLSPAAVAYIFLCIS